MGPFVLDAARDVLLFAGEPLALGPRVVATLAALAARPGEVVTKDELLDRVWPGEDVSESNVAQSVYVLRKAFRDHGEAVAIATVPRRGYRLVAQVDPVAFEAPTRPEAAAPRRRTIASVVAALAAALLLVVPGAHMTVRMPELSASGIEHYRLARYFWNLRTPSALTRSVALFTDVERSDPRSPFGAIGLADAELMLADYGHSKRVAEQHGSRARKALLRALRIDPDSAAAHTTHAMLLELDDQKMDEAEAEFRHALALDPTYPLAHHWYGTLLLGEGRVTAAMHELRTAVALDPVSPSASSWLGSAAYGIRNYDEAIRYARQALQVDPGRADALRLLGVASEQRGAFADAIAAFHRYGSIRGNEADAAALLAEAYARTGRRREALALLRIALHPSDDVDGAIMNDNVDAGLALLALGQRRRAESLLGPRQQRDPLEPRLALYGAAPT